MEYFGCHGIRKSCGTFLHHRHKYDIMKPYMIPINCAQGQNNCV